jgi:hypothetical protein
MGRIPTAARPGNFSIKRKKVTVDPFDPMVNFVFSSDFGRYVSDRRPIIILIVNSKGGVGLPLLVNLGERGTPPRACPKMTSTFSCLASTFLLV